ncbi:DUF4260 domain-containing protein [Imperialibacter roseus]|uniref:DUF4260 domain-containing protein n=1 Tax=Imperialibacter roseus TaxID=1324217 RepID=A0ABZ0INN3_9BACT|nr:DUF4260 domain-containing protein [Imperialibacter roseus]WOK05590.1 DUF4260 domain-containing protein [Imperialibacter roseus]
MKSLLNLEEAAMFIAAFLGTIYLDYAWWLFFAWLLAPDVSMIGYLFNTKIGAVFYNLAHHKGVAVACFVTGFVISSPEWMFAGLLLFGHSAMDRVFGYGLKYADDFKHTHLGWIGKK